MGLAIVLVLMDAADGAAGEAFAEDQQRPPVCGHRVYARRRGERRHVGDRAVLYPGRTGSHDVLRGGHVRIMLLHPQAAGGPGGILRCDQAVGRAGGVHGLVVQHDPHAAPGSLVHRVADIVHVPVGQVGDRPGQSLARMDDKARHPMGAEVIDLAGDLRLGQFIVPEPEGHGGEFVRWMKKIVKKAFVRHGALRQTCCMRPLYHED